VIPLNFISSKARKAQVEAPIELFVAVIILAMSMALALSVWNNMQEQECVAKIKTTMSRLQNSLVYLAQGSPPSTRIETLSFPRCGKYDIKAVQFAYFSKPEYCQLCVGHYGSCWQLIPLSYGSDGKYRALTDAITCVQLSGRIELSWDSTCSSENVLKTAPCPDPDGCNGKVYSIPTELCSDCVYRSLGRPEEGNSYVLRLTSSKASAPEIAKDIRVCAMTPGDWARENAPT